MKTKVLSIERVLYYFLLLIIFQAVKALISGVFKFDPIIGLIYVYLVFFILPEIIIALIFKNISNIYKLLIFLLIQFILYLFVYYFLSFKIEPSVLFIIFLVGLMSWIIQYFRVKIKANKYK